METTEFTTVLNDGTIGEPMTYDEARAEQRRLNAAGGIDEDGEQSMNVLVVAYDVAVRAFGPPDED